MPEQTISDLLSVNVDSLETKFLETTNIYSFKTLGPNGEIIFDSTQQTIPGFIADTASLALTASTAPSYLLLAGGTITGNLTVNGTTTLNNVVTVTSSYSSGSTIFGDALIDTHRFTGSVFITGSSFTWNNSTLIASNVTSSMSVASASQALTSSLSLRVSGSLTGSLLGTAATASNTPNALITGSVTANVITLTKGDGSSFNLTVDTGSGGTSTPTGSLLVTASATANQITFTKGDASQFTITVDTGSISPIDTGSFVTTSSFNSFTSSYNTGSFSGSFTGNLIGTASFASTASFVSSNFQYEIHVSQVDGNDTTGNGDLLKPVATIGKALLLVSASVASTDRRTIIVHPGTYIENITINTTNTYFFSTGVLGANCLISGSVTISAATRMSGIKMTNLIVSSSNPIYINNCAVDKQMTVSGSGYLEVQNTSLQCTSGIQVVGPASSGVIFENCSLYPLTVNNASAAVYVISCNQAITPTLTAGALTITRSTISSLTSGATSTALTTAAGSVLVLESCNVYNSLLTSHAAITANGFYSIKNVIYNRSASTLASLSGTGGPLATVSQFQYINADNINSTQGLTVTGSLNITGSQTITGLLTVTQNISASSFTGSLFGTASFATSASQAVSASYVLTASYATQALTASYAINAGSGGGGGTDLGLTYAISIGYFMP